MITLEEFREKMKNNNYTSGIEQNTNISEKKPVTLEAFRAKMNNSNYAPVLTGVNPVISNTQAEITTTSPILANNSQEYNTYAGIKNAVKDRRITNRMADEEIDNIYTKPYSDNEITEDKIKSSNYYNENSIDKMYVNRVDNKDITPKIKSKIDYDPNIINKYYQMKNDIDKKETTNKTAEYYNKQKLQALNTEYKLSQKEDFKEGINKGKKESDFKKYTSTIGYDNLSQEQKDTIAYLFYKGKQNGGYVSTAYTGFGGGNTNIHFYGELEDYIKSIESDINAAKTKQAEKGSADFAETVKKVPVIGDVTANAVSAITNFGGNIGSTIATVGNKVKNIFSDEYIPYDKNNQYRVGIAGSQALDDKFLEDKDDTYKYLYGTGKSIIESMLGTMTGPTMGLATMGLNAGGATADEVIQKGGTVDQALTMGLVSGGIETLTEKLPLDNFFSLVGRIGKKTAQETGKIGFKAMLKTGVKDVLKQSGIEASEELISEYANTLADMSIMGENSDYNLYIKDLVKNGTSEDEAKKQANVEFFAKQPLLSALGGAISGTVFGGVGSLANMSNTSKYGKDIKNSGEYNNLLDQAQNLDGKPKAISDNMINTKNVKNYDIGNLAVRVNEQSKENPVYAIAEKFNKGENISDNELHVLYNTDKNWIKNHNLFKTLTANELPSDITQIRAFIRKGVRLNKENGFNQALAERNLNNYAKQNDLITEEYTNNNDIKTVNYGNKKIEYKPAIEIPQNIQNIADKLGIDVEYSDGGIKVFSDGKPVLSDGISLGNGKIIIDSRNSEKSAEYLFGHETMHEVLRTSKDKSSVLNAVLEYRNRLGYEQQDINTIKGIKDAYKKQGINLTEQQAIEEFVSNIAGENMNSQEFVEYICKEDLNLAQRIWKAIKNLINKLRNIDNADIKSNIKNLTEFQEMLGDEILKYKSQNNVENSKNNTQNFEKDNNIKYYINPNFEKSYENWDKKTSGIHFKIGTTSKVLQDIGIDDKKIYWDSSKILKIKKDHPGMGDNVIKQVPNILDNPILIMKSMTVKDRIVLFGEVYDNLKKPVLVALELNANSIDGTEINVIKIASAYGKDMNLQSFIDKSNIIYVNPNKEKTQSWLSINRLKLPLGISNSEFTNINISQSEDDVKHSIRNNSENDTENNKKDTKLSGYVANNKKFNDMPESIKTEVDKMIQSGELDYTVFTNEKSNKDSVNIVNSLGYDEAVKSWKNGDFNEDFLKHINIGQVLLKQAMAKGDRDTAVLTLMELSSISTKHGQAIQAISMLSKLSPEGKLYIAQKMVDNLNKQNEKKIQKGKMKKIELSEELVDFISKASQELSKSYDIEQSKYKEVAKKYDEVMLKYDEANKNLIKLEKQLKELKKDTKATDKSAENKQNKINDLQQKIAEQEKILEDKKALEEEMFNELEKARNQLLKAKENVKKAKEKYNLEIIDESIIKDIASQIPSTWLDKLNAWRYLSMLGNPKTHIRNILGNAVFMPVRFTKNTLATLFEKTIKQENRTKSFLTSKDKHYKEYAKIKFDEVKKELTSTGKYNPKHEIMDNRTIYKTKWLEKIRKLNGDLLNAEDIIFLKNAYVDSYARAMKARKYTEAFLNSDSKGAENARNKLHEYASDEALKATYRDESIVADAISNFSNKNKFTNVLVEGILPFKKTPINILKRGTEYSPIGLTKTLTKGLYDVKNGNITAAKFIDDICSGLTGSALLALGAWLASMGFIKGGRSDKDEEAYAKAQGEQFYSVKIGNHYYSIDWVAPVSMPFFVGVEIFNELSKKEHSTTDILDAVTRITEPMFEMSMLQGVSQAIETAGYGEGNAITNIVSNSVGNYVSQYVPTALGQLARTIDPVSRNAYYKDKNSPLPGSAQIIINKNLAKIPGASMLLPERVDVWGREQRNDNLLDRIFQNFVSPGYYSQKNETEVDKVINDLYKKTGEKSIIPKSPEKKITVDGVDKNLTAEEYVELSKITGQNAHEIVGEMVKTSAFKSMTDQEKSDAIYKVYTLSKSIAKEKVDSRYNLSSSQQEIIDAKKTYGASKGEYIAGQALISKIQSDVDEDGETISGSKKKKVTQTIQNSNLSDNAKVAVLAGSYEKLADYANKSYDYGMGYGNFVEIYNELSQLSSDKNYKGETVSGSLKKKQLRVLYKWGLRGKQLQLFKEMLNIK